MSVERDLNGIMPCISPFLTKHWVCRLYSFWSIIRTGWQLLLLFAVSGCGDMTPPHQCSLTAGGLARVRLACTRISHSKWPWPNTHMHTGARAHTHTHTHTTQSVVSVCGSGLVANGCCIECAASLLSLWLRCQAEIKLTLRVGWGAAQHSTEQQAEQQLNEHRESFIFITGV